MNGDPYLNRYEQYRYRYAIAFSFNNNQMRHETLEMGMVLLLIEIGLVKMLLLDQLACSSSVLVTLSVQLALQFCKE